MQIKAGDVDIRVINGYGPQECDNRINVNSFWQEIEIAIESAKEENCFVILQMDANAKLGKHIIPGDPNEMSENGKILNELVKRQNLTVLNSLELCQGVITRQRVTQSVSEKAVIDYIIVCDQMSKFVNEVIIDDHRIHTFTKCVDSKGPKEPIVSDHNNLYSKFY